MHFAGPSWIKEFNEKSCSDMITKTQELLRLEHDIFLFASSMGVKCPSDNYYQTLYNKAKKKCEDLIISKANKYIILRIPRVYSSERKKGLMYFIRNNEIQNYNINIEYYDIYDFINETIDFLRTTKEPFNIIKEYNSPTSKTIREIKEIYKL